MSKRWQYLTIELSASMLKGGPTAEKIQAASGVPYLFAYGLDDLGLA